MHVYNNHWCITHEQLACLILSSKIRVPFGGVKSNRVRTSVKKKQTNQIKEMYAHLFSVELYILSIVYDPLTPLQPI